MAKKVTEQPKRVKIFSTFYSGYLDEMTEEAKDKMKAEKPDTYKKIFEIKNN